MIFDALMGLFIAALLCVWVVFIGYLFGLFFAIGLIVAAISACIGFLVTVKE